MLNTPEIKIQQHYIVEFQFSDFWFNRSRTTLCCHQMRSRVRNTPQMRFRPELCPWLWWVCGDLIWSFPLCYHFAIFSTQNLQIACKSFFRWSIIFQSCILLADHLLSERPFICSAMSFWWGHINCLCCCLGPIRCYLLFHVFFHFLI